MAAHIRSMSGGVPNGPGPCTTVHKAPLRIFMGHKDEGFALTGALSLSALSCLVITLSHSISMDSQHIVLSADSSDSLLNSSLINS
jgi:hypothetical protein